MELDQLIAFERIVREGSFSRAAWALQIGQPAISTRILTLEQELGGALFIRGGRKLTLTPLGEQFLPYVRRALGVLHEGLDVAKAAQTAQHGRVTLGTLVSLAGNFLGAAAATFYATHPLVECVIRAGDHEKMLELLVDDVVELALIGWPCVAPPQTELVPLLRLREPVVLVLAAAHPLAQQQTVTQADLIACREPFFFPRWWPAPQIRVAELAQQVPVARQVPIEMARYLLLQGQGAAFFTRTLMADALASGQVVELPVTDLPPIYRETALLHRQRTTPLSPAVQDFVACVRRQAESMGLLHG
jgi:LysR family transcriptional regulator, low CO2-responsive transcriptional regulator